MKHRIRKGRKFNRSKGHRLSLLRNLLTSFLAAGEVETTLAKAKELKTFSERTLSWARRANLSSQRKIFSLITRKETARKLFDEILPAFKNRSSGFVRVVKLGPRMSDGSERARLELVRDQDENKDAQ